MTQGLLCDVHGVLYVYPDALPGSVEAVERLVDRGYPHLFLTNSSLYPKSWILESLRREGFPITADQMMTAVEAAGDFLAGAGLKRVGWLCQEGLLEDLPDVDAVLPEKGDTSSVDAVLVGDIGQRFTYDTLNQAFRWLHNGARLVAIARNRYYQTHEGLILDSGPFVTLLEYAAQTEAHVIGKPSHAFFESGLRRLGLNPDEAAMVGDDFEGDVLPAMDLGIRGIQVRTGKFRKDRYGVNGETADVVLADLAEAVDLVLGEQEASGK
jgi:HAD superfamily hydrolase (TIGR01458 family)